MTCTDTPAKGGDKKDGAKPANVGTPKQGEKKDGGNKPAAAGTDLTEPEIHTNRHRQRHRRRRKRRHEPTKRGHLKLSYCRHPQAGREEGRRQARRWCDDRLQHCCHLLTVAGTPKQAAKPAAAGTSAHTLCDETHPTQARLSRARRRRATSPRLAPLSPTRPPLSPPLVRVLHHVSRALLSVCCTQAHPSRVRSRRPPRAPSSPPRSRSSRRAPALRANRRARFCASNERTVATIVDCVLRNRPAKSSAGANPQAPSTPPPVAPKAPSAKLSLQ